MAPETLSPKLTCLRWWVTPVVRAEVRLDLPHPERRPVVVPAVVWWPVPFGCTVVVVLTVWVLALRPRRRVMRVGLVVLVTVALRRDRPNAILIDLLWVIGVVYLIKVFWCWKLWVALRFYFDLIWLLEYERRDITACLIGNNEL